MLLYFFETSIDDIERLYSKISIKSFLLLDSNNSICFLSTKYFDKNPDLYKNVLISFMFIFIILLLSSSSQLF